MSNLSINQINQEILPQVYDFLQNHEESAQLLTNNIRNQGCYRGENSESANFKCIIDNSDGSILSVFGLIVRGYVLVETKPDYQSLTTDMIFESILQEQTELIKILAFVGDWDSVVPVLKLYTQANPDFKCDLNSGDILYRFTFNETDNTKHHSQVRLLTFDDYEVWSVVQDEFRAEIGAPPKNDEMKRIDFAKQVNDQVSWGMFDEAGLLLSSCYLFSMSLTMGVVGGVYTNKQNRQKGYSRTTLIHMLYDCKIIHKHQKSILFTGENMISAQKTYESIGYERVGKYAYFDGSI